MIPVYECESTTPALPDGHRFPMDKYHLTREQLLHEGVIRPEQCISSPEADPADLLAVHHPAYLDALATCSLDARQERRLGFPQSPLLYLRSRRSVGGTLEAARQALHTGAAANLAGGTHHAYTDRGEGFCMLNDLAITAEHLLRHGLSRKVLIIDLDVHQGNGTAAIFRHRPEVFTFSMHGRDNYPLHKETSDLDIGLAPGTDGDTYLELLGRALTDISGRFEPDFVLYQSGVDVLATDRLGKLALTRHACYLRDLTVFRWCRQRGLPVVSTMGGGYSHRVADTVDGHAGTLRALMEVYG